MNIDFNTLQPGTYLENEGGYYVERVKYPDGTVWALILAPKKAESRREWSAVEQKYFGTDSEFDGFSNSEYMVDEYSAASYCRSYTGGGKTDWYLASKDEMEIIYRHLKPTAHINHSKSGTNEHAYPVTTQEYEKHSPAQTKNLMFCEGGDQAFRVSNGDDYWTSTQYRSDSAFICNFRNGEQFVFNKTDINWVRPIRKIRIA